MITEWAPALLRMELDRWLWKDADHVSVRQIWEYMAQYIYLPRLRNQDVLSSTIRNGVNAITWADHFAYASGWNDTEKRYVGLVTGGIPAVSFGPDSLLVKPDAARKQLAAETSFDNGLAPTDKEPDKGVSEDGTTIAPAIEKTSILRRFHGSVELDPTRLGRDAGRIADEVVGHLTSLGGAKTKITLEIDVEVPGGIPEDRVRIISENANTLKFNEHEFEEL